MYTRADGHHPISRSPCPPDRTTPEFISYVICNLHVSRSFVFLAARLRQETDAAVRVMTSSLEEKSGGRFLLLWTGDFHDVACGRRCVYCNIVTSAVSRVLAMCVRRGRVLPRFLLVRGSVESGAWSSPLVCPFQRKNGCLPFRVRVRVWPVWHFVNSSLWRASFCVPIVCRSGMEKFVPSPFLSHRR